MKVQIKILNKEFYADYSCKDPDGCLEMSAQEFLPQYATAGSAALDLIVTEDVTIRPQQRVKIHTGLAIWLGGNVLDNGPHSIAALILPRSGLGSKGLVLANTIGLVDGDYQGELIVNVWNNNIDHDIDRLKLNGSPFVQKCAEGLRRDIELKAGDRFAQLTFIPVLKAQWDIVEEFTQTTDRGTGGFGSTS